MDTEKKIVFDSRPTLQNIYKEKGDVTLLEYYASVLGNGIKESLLQEVLKKEIMRIFGDAVLADRAGEYLSRNGYISSVDHHGVISHPAFVQAHVAQAVANGAHKENIVLVFSSGSVSLDNHTFPRGVSFHGEAGETKIPFFSSEKRHGCVLGMPGVDRDVLLQNLRNVHIPEQVTNALDVEGMNKMNFSDYATRASRSLFRLFPRMNDVDFIMIPHEKISARIISESEDFQKMLFGERFLDVYEKAFSNVKGAHVESGGQGTLLFWHVKDTRRAALARRGEVLETKDGAFSISYTKETILPLLESGELIPCLALSYAIIGSFGVTLGGGFNQVDYLDAIYRADDSLRVALGLPSATRGIPNHMGGDIVYTGLKQNNKVQPATFLDLLSRVSSSEETRFFDTLETVTLAEAMEGVISDAYYTDTGKRITTSNDPAIIF